MGPGRLDASARPPSENASESYKYWTLLVKPEDLDIAGLHFHPLKGKPPRWSVRVTGNYRVTFGWLSEDAVEVGYEDYH